MVKVTPNLVLKTIKGMTLYKKDKKDMVTDISFSKHARRQIGKYIKGTYHKQLSNALNKQIHIYSPQKLLKTLQQAKILPKLRQMLNVVLDNPPVTDLAAACLKGRCYHRHGVVF